MKRVIIPILVSLVGFLGLTVHDQSENQKKQQMNQVVEDASKSQKAVDEAHDLIYMRKMNADRHL